MDISKFNTEAAARGSLEHKTKPGRIFLGDDNLFWVVGMADGEKLLKGGYEELRNAQPATAEDRRAQGQAAFGSKG